MTSDPFTDAARAEAERRHPAPEIETGAWLPYTQTEIREVVRRTFANAAVWARDYLAAQEPTDAEVEAFQKCLYERTLTWVPTVEARAALSAARAARRDEETTR